MSHWCVLSKRAMTDVYCLFCQVLTCAKGVDFLFLSLFFASFCSCYTRFNLEGEIQGADYANSFTQIFNYLLDLVLDHHVHNGNHDASQRQQQGTNTEQHTQPPPWHSHPDSLLQHWNKQKQKHHWTIHTATSVTFPSRLMSLMPEHSEKTKQQQQQNLDDEQTNIT